MTQQEQLLGMAGLVTYLQRNAKSECSLQLLGVLLAVAGGVDNRADLVEQLGYCDHSVRNCLSILLGRGGIRNYPAGKKPSALRMIETYKHPHKKGSKGYRLSPEGLALMNQLFGEKTP